MTSDSPAKSGGFKWSHLLPRTKPGQKAAAAGSKEAGGPKFKMKLPKLFGANAPQIGRVSASAADGRSELRDTRDHTAPAPAPPTFEEHLRALRLAEAGRLLLDREERLFGDGRAGPEGWAAEDAAALAADRLALEEEVVRTLGSSLDDGDADALASAVGFMLQEEECDDAWERRGGMPPPWRLRDWRKVHDKTLQNLVEERMDALPAGAGPGAEQSSIQADVHGMGRQLRSDLLQVARRVRPCYPDGRGVCQLYAASYHRCVGARLRKLADFGLDDRDCTFLLRWVNDFYPQLLQEVQLATDIDTRAFPELLPEDLLSPLEEQYLSRQEGELSTYLGRILDQAQEAWAKGEEPPREDGCFVSTVAYDVIQMVHGMASAAEKVLGDFRKARNLTCQLQEMLHRFRNFQADVIKRNRANSDALVKANLGCVAQFEDFVRTHGRLFPEDVGEACLSVLSDMKESAHEYLLGPVRRNLKRQLPVRNFFSHQWLKKSTLDGLRSALDHQMLQLQGPPESAYQGLIGQLYQDICVEYVRQLLKGEIRLRGKRQQQQAADNVDQDARALRHYFSGHGCKEAWPQDPLSMMAEVLKLQDVPAIQFQVASLAAAFPDVSEKHVLCLLKLKTNLSKEDKNNVRAVLAEIPKDLAQPPPFFSLVPVK